MEILFLLHYLKLFILNSALRPGFFHFSPKTSYNPQSTYGSKNSRKLWYLIKIDLFLTEPTYPYPEHIVYEYRFPNENRIERWPLDQCTRYPNSAESNSPPLLWESAGSSPEYLMNSAAAPRSSRLANIYFCLISSQGSTKKPEFWPKINTLEENCCFKIQCVTDRQKWACF